MKISTVHRKKPEWVAVLLAAVMVLSSCSLNAGKNNDIGKETASAAETDNESFAADADDYLCRIGFQGAVLAAIGDDVIFEKYSGTEDIMDSGANDIDEHSTFEIGSMTKQITAACVLMQEESGALSTSDTLDKYFPDYKHGDKITVDMLLHMRSGLTDPINAPNDFFPKDVAQELALAEVNCTPVEEDIVMRYFFDAPLKFTPDEKMEYCNMNYFLLACIVEQTSGMTFDEYVRENIFDPCGMTDSNLDFQGTSTKAYDGSGRYYSIPKPLAKGAGEINSSVRDLFKWNRALYSGKILGEDALQKMLTPVDGYACGLFANGRSVYHGGLTDVYNSYGEYYQNDGMLIIVLENSPYVTSTAIAGNIRKMYLGI